MYGGDLASTWVAKLEGHVEDVTHLVKYVTKHIDAKKRIIARQRPANQPMVELAAAA